MPHVFMADEGGQCVKGIHSSGISTQGAREKKYLHGESSERGRERRHGTAYGQVWGSESSRRTAMPEHLVASSALPSVLVE